MQQPTRRDYWILTNSLMFIVVGGIILYRGIIAGVGGYMLPFSGLFIFLGAYRYMLFFRAIRKVGMEQRS